MKIKFTTVISTNCFYEYLNNYSRITPRLSWRHGDGARDSTLNLCLSRTVATATYRGVRTIIHTRGTSAINLQTGDTTVYPGQVISVMLSERELLAVSWRNVSRCWCYRMSRHPSSHT